MSRPAAALLALLLTLVLGAGAAHAATYPTGFEEQTLVSGLSQPMAVDWTPDGRTLIVEKSGLLKVAAPGSTTATVATGGNFQDRVNDFHDRGMLGVAVDAQYATNNYVYLLYTYDLNQLAKDGGGLMVSQLLRIKLSPANVVSDAKVLVGTYTAGACPTASNTVDCIPSDYNSHSIGTVRTAPDGTIFLGSGDAASYNEADVRALRTYDETSLAGKILRIDREGRGVGGHPFCPTNTNLAHNCTKLFAKGLRNPFRFELRPDGGLAIGDVGWNITEEVNIAPPGGGKSYGWPCYEGTERTAGYNGWSQCTAEYNKPAGTHTAPTLAWCHCGTGASSLGGPTYTGTGARYPAAYTNNVFYGDYAKGFVRRLVPNGSGGWSDQPFATGWLGVDLTLDPQGDLTFVTPGNFGNGQGAVVALRYAAANRAPVAKIVSDKTSGPAPLTVAFDATQSTDPDGDALTYSWAFGDATTSTASKPSKTYTTAGAYTVTLTVTDARGRSSTATTVITAGNSAPTATITAPANLAKFTAGQVVQLTGTATDPQDGTLPSGSLTWNVQLRHNDHTHPEATLTGANVSFTARDDHDADSYYEIVLTATDSGGLTATKSIRLDPLTSQITLASQPAGAPMSYAGLPFTAPLTQGAAVGFKAGIDAAERFTSGGKTYVFQGWSDGGARSHTVTIPTAPLSVTATYAEEPVTPPPGGPVLALAFDETSGTTAQDRSGTGNHAVLEHGARFAPGGHAGGALSVAEGAWASVADHPSLDLTTQMTLEAWVRPSERGDWWRTVMLKELPPDWQSYGLYSSALEYGGAGNGDEPAGFAEGSAVRGPGPLPLNAWSHLAMTYDGAIQRLYVDGVQVATTAKTGAMPVGSGALRIGANGIWPEPFAGLIDDVRVYGRALTAAEIVKDRDTPVGTTGPTQPTGPVPAAAYGFEETSGATTTDSSSHAAVAQVNGATRIAGGKRGRALDFDGVDDRVIVPDAPWLRLGQTFTYSAWVKPDATTGWRTVMLKELLPDWQSIALYSSSLPYAGDQGADGEPSGFASWQGVRSTVKPQAGVWTHLALTYDGTKLALYVGGVKRSEVTTNAMVTYDASPLSIGGNGVWGEWYDGAIDEVRVFDEPLTAAQIQADMERVIATSRARAARVAPLSKRSAKAAKRAGAGTRGGKRVKGGGRAKVLRGARASLVRSRAHDGRARRGGRR